MTWWEVALYVWAVLFGLAWAFIAGGNRRG